MITEIHHVALVAMNHSLAVEEEARLVFLFALNLLLVVDHLSV